MIEEDKLEDVSISEDRKSFVVSLAEFEKSEEKWIDRIYHLVVNEEVRRFWKCSFRKVSRHCTTHSVPGRLYNRLSQSTMSIDLTLAKLLRNIIRLKAARHH